VAYSGDRKAFSDDRPVSGMTLRSRSCIALSSLAIILSGCAVVWPDYERPAIDLPPPAVERPAVIDRQWWKAFSDPALDRLVDEALKQNFDLAKAAAAVAEARATAGSARALQSPRIDAIGKIGSSQYQIGSSFSQADFDQVTSTASGGLALTWELDLWDRIKQMNDAALARVSASEHTRNAAELSVSSAVVDTWLQLRSLDAKLAVTRDAVASLRAVSELEYRRWKADTGTQLAYQQSLAELVSTEARVPTLEAAIAKTELALQLLVGRSPRGMSERLAREVVPKVPEPPREVDSIVLLRRPDVASAEMLLVAAHADINSARAEFYPRVTLSLIAGLVASTSNAISGVPLFWEAAAGLNGPLYDGGLVQSKVDGAEARRDKALAHYRYTVSLAFRDTYEALVQIDTSDRQVKSSEEEVGVRRRSQALSERSYAAGRSTKFEVLAETMKVLNAEMQLADARYNQLSARSRYYKAVGGGF
jgi:outer membrane protein, multidrug efflux system